MTLVNLIRPAALEHDERAFMLLVLKIDEQDEATGRQRRGLKEMHESVLRLDTQLRHQILQERPDPFDDEAEYLVRCAMEDIAEERTNELYRQRWGLCR